MPTYEKYFLPLSQLQLDQDNGFAFTGDVISVRHLSPGYQRGSVFFNEQISVQSWGIVPPKSASYALYLGVDLARSDRATTIHAFKVHCQPGVMRMSLQARHAFSLDLVQSNQEILISVMDMQRVKLYTRPILGTEAAIVRDNINIINPAEECLVDNPYWMPEDLFDHPDLLHRRKSIVDSYINHVKQKRKRK